MFFVIIAGDSQEEDNRKKKKKTKQSLWNLLGWQMRKLFSCFLVGNWPFSFTDFYYYSTKEDEQTRAPTESFTILPIQRTVCSPETSIDILWNIKTFMFGRASHFLPWKKHSLSMHPTSHLHGRWRGCQIQLGKFEKIESRYNIRSATFLCRGSGS